MSDLQEIFPNGIPQDFPVGLFDQLVATDNPDMVLTDAKLQHRIDDLIDLIQGTDDEIELPVDHMYANGVYARRMYAPKGTLVVGKIHLSEHINILLQGAGVVLTSEGPKFLKAPAMFVSPACTRKVGYVTEDLIWVAFHQASEGESPEEVIARGTVDKFSQLQALIAQAEDQKELICQQQS